MRYIEFLEGRRGYSRRENLEVLVEGECLASLASDQEYLVSSYLSHPQLGHLQTFGF
jgi:hypothetical protein